MLFGADIKTTLDYLRLRFFKLDRLGHIGVEIEVDNKGEFRIG